MKEITLKAIISEAEEEILKIQFQEFIKNFSNNKPTKEIQLNDVEPGGIFSVGDFEVIALEHSGNTTVCLLKNYYDRLIQFDATSNNWINSNIEYVLNTDFYHSLAKAVGKNNIVEHSVEIITDDGFTDYGRTKDYISIFSTDLHRKYRTIVDNGRALDKWIWTLTPLAKNSCYLRYIEGLSGILRSVICDTEGRSRPYFFLDSGITVVK